MREETLLLSPCLENETALILGIIWFLLWAGLLFMFPTSFMIDTEKTRNGWVKQEMDDDGQVWRKWGVKAVTRKWKWCETDRVTVFQINFRFLTGFQINIRKTGKCPVKDRPAFRINTEKTGNGPGKA